MTNEQSQSPPHPSLVPLESALHQVRELYAWPEADRVALGTRLGEMSLAWHQRWELCPDGPPLGVSNQVLCEELPDPTADSGAAAALWHEVAFLGATGQGMSGVWYRLEPDFPSLLPGEGGAMPVASLPPHAVLLMAMFEDANSGTTGRVADDVAHSAWVDWYRCLAELFQPYPNAVASIASQDESGQDSFGVPLPGDMASRWSGTLQVTMPWCGQVLVLAISEDRARACLGKSPLRTALNTNAASQGKGLVPVLDALSDRPMALRVDLLELELDLGSLTTLQVGDVLATAHPLDAPLRVGGNPRQLHDPVWCGGYLGRRGLQRAIELVPFPPAPPSRPS